MINSIYTSNPAKVGVASHLTTQHELIESEIKNMSFFICLKNTKEDYR